MTSQNGHNDCLFLHGLKSVVRNYYVAHAFVVFIKINNEDWFLMLSPFILVLHKFRCSVFNISSTSHSVDLQRASPHLCWPVFTIMFSIMSDVISTIGFNRQQDYKTDNDVVKYLNNYKDILNGPMWSSLSHTFHLCVLNLFFYLLN